MSHRINTTALILGLLLSPSGLASGTGAECAAELGQRPLPQGVALQTRFAVLSWNIQKASNTGWAEDFAAIAQDAQLVFIQEASLQAGIPALVQESSVEVFAPGYRTASLDTGVMTLGSATPSLACSFTAMEPWLGTPKATSVAEYAIEGRDQRLLAINLHAVNFALGLDSFEAQFRAIGDVLDNHTGPVIFAGDLNTWSESRQQLVDSYMREYGLTAVSFEPDLRTRAFGNALDHIYLRGLQAETTAVIPMESSDHNALRVGLVLE